MEHPHLRWGSSAVSHTRADCSADAWRSLQSQQYAHEIILFIFPEEMAFHSPDFCVKKLNVKTPSCHVLICFTLRFSTRIPWLFLSPSPNLLSEKKCWPTASESCESRLLKQICMWEKPILSERNWTRGRSIKLPSRSQLQALMRTVR